MNLVTDKIKVIVPVLGMFKPVSCVYNQNSNNLETSFHKFVSNSICKGDAVYCLVEETARKMWDLDLARSSCASSDGVRTLIGGDKHYEVRCMNKGGPYWGPATSTGHNREPKVDDDDGEWLKHHHIVMDKIEFIDYYIVCDISYPPYWFFYEVPSNSVMTLYEEGILVHKVIQRDGVETSIIKNKMTRNQFYTHFFNMKRHNPHRINCKDVNIFEVSEDDENKSIKELGYDVTQTSWEAMKLSAKKLKPRSNELVNL